MSIIVDFITLFFPRYCSCCYRTLVRGEDVMCTQCFLDLPRMNYPPKANPVVEKLAAWVQLDYGFAFLKFNKGGIVQRLLHRLKYEQRSEIGVKLGKLCGKALLDKGHVSQFDLIVPVPLHSSKLRKRGYNQSAKFAEGLSHALGIPWSDAVLIRAKRTPTQTNKLVWERWNNVKSAFRVPHAEQVRQKKILLIDDVITTGSTLAACSRCLLSAGCAELGVVCLAEA